MLKKILKYIWIIVWHRIVLRWQQFFRFCVVGTIGAIIDIGGLWILVEFVGIHYLIAATMSFTLAVINNYFLNKYWTFEDGNKQHLKQFLIFIAVSVIGLLINLSAMWLMVEKIAMWYLLSKAIASIIVLAWNFFMNKYITFKN